MCVCVCVHAACQPVSECYMLLCGGTVTRGSSRSELITNRCSPLIQDLPSNWRLLFIDSVCRSRDTLRIQLYFTRSQTLSSSVSTALATGEDSEEKDCGSQTKSRHLDRHRWAGISYWNQLSRWSLSVDAFTGPGVSILCPLTQRRPFDRTSHAA